MKILMQKKKKPAPKVLRYSNFDINFDRKQLTVVVDALKHCLTESAIFHAGKAKIAYELMEELKAGLNKKVS